MESAMANSVNASPKKTTATTPTTIQKAAEIVWLWRARWRRPIAMNPMLA
jgi:hypothetical protein